jgi:hypothetical protein
VGFGFALLGFGFALVGLGFAVVGFDCAFGVDGGVDLAVVEMAASDFAFGAVATLCPDVDWVVEVEGAVLVAGEIADMAVEAGADVAACAGCVVEGFGAAARARGAAFLV